MKLEVKSYLLDVMPKDGALNRDVNYAKNSESRYAKDGAMFFNVHLKQDITTRQTKRGATRKLSATNNMKLPTMIHQHRHSSYYNAIIEELMDHEDVDVKKGYYTTDKPTIELPLEVEGLYYTCMLDDVLQGLLNKPSDDEEYSSVSFFINELDVEKGLTHVMSLVQRQLDYIAEEGNLYHDGAQIKDAKELAELLEAAED